MKILGVSMQDKTALIIGGVGLVLVYSAYKKASDAVGNGLDAVGNALGTTKDALSNPMDNLLAGWFGILPNSATASNTAPTVGFSSYINSLGGIDAYIAAHKNGTFNGKPYTPPAATDSPSKVINQAWLDPLGLWQ